ncbi:hypothetical protein [Methylobacter sp. YRD-M1]|uniref:hypothetical protein n=1 Tax=Methylobacter sp. YRD-M1 TaxID=2911520 RepID=UPI00227A17F8|nr:hypothetical protein [Methylobacter sp. YRD-M1]WAK01568.1 hypothetical protein LZ558_17320 [Methylobacter sp. YRD-M1]
MKKLLLVLALAAFAPLSYADNKAKDDAKEHVKKAHEKGQGKVKEKDDAEEAAEEIAEAIEEIIANNGKVPANETAKAVKELKASVREAVLNGLITRLDGSNALNGLEIALSKGGQNPVSPS